MAMFVHAHKHPVDGKNTILFPNYKIRGCFQKHKKLFYKISILVIFPSKS